MRQPPGAYHNSASSTSRSAGAATSLNTVASTAWLVCCCCALVLLLVQWSTDGNDANSGDTDDDDDGVPRGSSSSWILMAVMMMIIERPNFLSCVVPKTSSQQPQKKIPSPSKTHCSTTNDYYTENGMSSRWKITMSPWMPFAALDSLHSISNHRILLGLRRNSGTTTSTTTVMMTIKRWKSVYRSAKDVERDG